ncbi:S41 family peptidase [uncultured Psychroserpens sp.]|uniref:S41 family peptidase n=1 Tax=uncultured Psychroserpens sp. TaxID=255436 RepID=UPI00261CFD5F|nr:S41 family peptidase [uncultured Psychroserpens sp.]
MKPLETFCIVLIFTISSTFAQSSTCDCKADLDFVVEKMKKMPSYKKQIKGKKAEEFTNTYNRLSAKMETPIPVEACYKMLLEQMLLVNDVHASIQMNNSYLSEDIAEDADKLSNFKASVLFQNHPKSAYNLRDLEKELGNKPAESLEGIYNYQKSQKIGIYYAENKKDLIGVVLNSSLNHWIPGEIRFYATHTTDNKYNVYQYDINTRIPHFVKSLSFENGRLWSYKKLGNTNNFEFPENDQPQLEFKQINENTQYLHFRNFSNSEKEAHLNFYKDVKDKITAKHIIVDLRSNSGGNKKYSDTFLKLLKSKKIYILTNCFTGSNGEQFTVKLKKLKHAIHLGQTTRGIIAYGKNYGYQYNTPSGHFKMTPTDMNFHKYIAFEGKGVAPDITLDYDKDWMQQTLEIIENRSN